MMLFGLFSLFLIKPRIGQMYLLSLNLPRCDPEWGGEYCDEPVVPLPSQLKDSFSRAPSLSHWHILTGGKLSTVCGAVASGAALHFSGVRIYLNLQVFVIPSFCPSFNNILCSESYWMINRIISLSNSNSYSPDNQMSKCPLCLASNTGIRFYEDNLQSITTIIPAYFLVILSAIQNTIIETPGFIFAGMTQVKKCNRNKPLQSIVDLLYTDRACTNTSAVCAQGCSRQLVTVDLNLTNAEFIQFYFMYGCMIPPSNRNQGVLLEYSLNGGINWHLLTEIFYDLYTKPG